MRRLEFDPSPGRRQNEVLTTPTSPSVKVHVGSSYMETLRTLWKRVDGDFIVNSEIRKEAVIKQKQQVNNSAILICVHACGLAGAEDLNPALPFESPMVLITC